MAHHFADTESINYEKGVLFRTGGSNRHRHILSKGRTDEVERTPHGLLLQFGSEDVAVGGLLVPGDPDALLVGVAVTEEPLQYFQVDAVDLVLDALQGVVQSQFAEGLLPGAVVHHHVVDQGAVEVEEDALKRNRSHQIWRWFRQ